MFLKRRRLTWQSRWWHVRSLHPSALSWTSSYFAYLWYHCRAMMSSSSCIPEMNIRHPKVSPAQFHPNSSWLGFAPAAEAAKALAVSERTMVGLIRRWTMIPIRCCWQGLWLAPGIWRQAFAPTRRQQHRLHQWLTLMRRLLQQAVEQRTDNGTRRKRRSWTRIRRRQRSIMLVFRSRRKHLLLH